MKKNLLIFLILLLFCSPVVLATTVTRTYTIQDKFFKPSSYACSAKLLLYTSTGRVIYYKGDTNDLSVVKVYFSIKIGGRYTFTLDRDEIKLIKGL
jgi:hypothetical protein